jgi:hypothetical protein
MGPGPAAPGGASAPTSVAPVEAIIANARQTARVRWVVGVTDEAEHLKFGMPYTP